MAALALRFSDASQAVVRTCVSQARQSSQELLR
jgi:hypothetical protein